MVFGAPEYFSTLLGQQFDGRHLIGFNAYIARIDLGTLHQQLQANKYLVSVLHHQTEVGGDIWLTLYGIDDDALSLCGRRRTKLDEGGETSTTHTNDTGGLDALNNLLGSQLGVSLHRLQLVRTINGFFPFVTFHINYNNRLTIASGINSSINLKHCTAD